MSYVDILILRFLLLSPVHGYELRKRVKQTAGVMLHNNSLYPALRRFEEAGAVTRTAEPSESGRPPRLVYTITPVGRDLLHDMIVDFPPDQAQDEVEFLARLGQFSLLTAAEQTIVLDAREEALRRQLAHMKEMHELGRMSEEAWSEVVTSELIRRYETELGWIAQLKERVAK